MQVRELMKHQVATVRDDDSLALAAQLMLWAGAHHLPVTHDGRLVGVLSERDVLRFRAEHPEQPLEHVVGEAMSTPPHFAYPDDSTAEAAGRMAMDHIG